MGPSREVSAATTTALKQLRIWVIDNGGQWTHREWRVLKYLGVTARIVPNDTPFSALAAEDLAGLVLSGGAPRVGVEGQLGNAGEYLDRATFPVLGICAGHQYMARHFGGDAAPGGSEFGAVELRVLPHANADLLAGVPERSTVWASHHDEVSRVPPDFEVLAESERCKVQAMRHPSRPFYGLQFHPEVEHSQYGVAIFENFVRVCQRHREA